METPICDFVEAYAGRGPLRLHMPGHKGGGPWGRLDITEVTGAPALYPASGILRQSEENAARLFGAARTIYSTEGSSLCIRAMLFLVRVLAGERGTPPLILAGRNAHRTFLSGAALMDVQVAWLQGENLLTCLPSPAEVARRLDALDPLPTAVYLTSPDYLGHRADIPGIAQVCHARGIPLLVDNAHGAYLRFLPEDQHPLSLGADLVCDSAHKTLPVLTGGAYLHLHPNAPACFRTQAERGLALFASTSPSWLILQSLDRCNALLAGEFPARLAACLQEAAACKACLEAAGFSLVGDEPLKITLAPKAYGYPGDALHARLREKGIEGEFADPDYLVLMLSPEIGREGTLRLQAALEEIPRRPPLSDAPPPLPRPEQVMPLREALLSPAENLPLERCLGRVLAEPCVSCPPAVPILISGERIEESALACFRYYGLSHLSCVRSGAVPKQAEQNSAE